MSLYLGEAMAKIDEAKREAFRQAKAEEEANNPQYVHGRKWALIWATIWTVVMVGNSIVPRIINAHEGYLSIHFAGMLLWLLVLLLFPIAAYAGDACTIGKAMLTFTALSLVVYLFGGTYTIIATLSRALMLALAPLMLLQPSIRYYSARHMELYTQHLSKSFGLGKGRDHF